MFLGTLASFLEDFGLTLGDKRQPRDRTLDIRAMIDHNTLQVFFAGGRVALTAPCKCHNLKRRIIRYL